jgi:acetyl-CoA C-acetyltransferase
MNVAIVSAVRTAIGNFGGSLRTVPAYDLAALVLNDAVKRAKVAPESVNMVLMAQNYQNGEYVNIARMGLLKAGWPVETVGMTVDRRCPSSLDALCLGTMMIQSGNADIVVAGGVESMSTAEFYVRGDIRWGIGGYADMAKGHGSASTWGLTLYDRTLRGRVMSQPEERFGIIASMMAWAEAGANEFGIGRQEADSWALESHRRAVAAMQSGKFDDEIVTVSVPQARGEPLVFSRDEHPRAETTLEALSKLRALMGGVCTAGNSCGENDGGSAVVLMSEAKAAQLGLKAMALVKAFAFAGADPRHAYRSATAAVNMTLAKSGMKLSDFDLIEIHEAFSAQFLANCRELGLTEKDYERINVNGSCVALGHPLGATGTRIATTLLHEMGRRDSRYGLIAICGGGGMGASAILKRPR